MKVVEDFQLLRVSLQKLGCMQEKMDIVILELLLALKAIEMSLLQKILFSSTRDAKQIAGIAKKDPQMPYKTARTKRAMPHMAWPCIISIK